VRVRAPPRQGRSRSMPGSLNPDSFSQELFIQFTSPDMCELMYTVSSDEHSGVDIYCCQLPYCLSTISPARCCVRAHPHTTCLLGNRCLHILVGHVARTTAARRHCVLVGFDRFLVLGLLDSRRPLTWHAQQPTSSSSPSSSSSNSSSS
jgi:hypothetical protein